MNYPRLLLGGLLATVILLIGEFGMIAVFGTQIIDARKSAGIAPFVAQPLVGIAEVLLSGILLTWLYAAVRPRFGPGVITSIKSGFVGWFALIFLSTVHTIWENLGFPPLLLITIALTLLPVFLLASIAGAWAYREQG